MERLTASYCRASADQIRRGLNWYSDGRALTADIAAKLGLKKVQTAGVIAVLSPSTGWYLQERNTLQFCADIVSGKDIWSAAGVGIGCRRENSARPDDTRCCANEEPIPGARKGGRCNRHKAQDILLGGDAHKIVSGPKVECFFHNFLGEESYVTVDIWAYRAWCGVDLTDNEVQKFLGRKGVRAQCQADYAASAAAVGISPAQFQAIVWVETLERVQAARAAQGVRSGASIPEWDTFLNNHLG